MDENITRRVKLSFDRFDSGAHEDIVKYLDWLQSTLSDISKTLRKTVALMLSLMAAFVLVGPHSEIDIGSLKVTNSSLVIVFLPVVISFLYFQIIRDTIQLLARSRAFIVAFSLWSPSAEENDLDALISPSRAAYWDLGGTGRPVNTSWAEKFGKYGQMGAAPVIGAGVIGFQVFAYINLHNSPTFKFTYWLISAIISGFFCGIAVCQISAKIWEDGPLPWRLPATALAYSRTVTARFRGKCKLPAQDDIVK
jgi:hypothetical protein